MTLTIAVANAKGGVAKTTTSLSLGAALIEQGQEVLLVDMDPHANLTISLGIRPEGLETTLTDVLLRDRPLQAVRRPTSVDGLALVPSNHELSIAEGHLMVREHYLLLMREAIRGSNEHDVIILDCPPTLGILTQNALTAADLLVIPTQPEYYSAHALRDMLNLILIIRNRHNPRLRYRILLTMLDNRNRIHRSLARQIRTAFREAAFESEIEVDTRLRESPIFGLPIQQYAPQSRAAEQYRQLASELRQYTNEFHRSHSTAA
ncbi:MAG TPA: ParA family protein [Chloroflexi bacterium]|nr:ParA family protein [Chloroflexota bacterium]